MVKLFTIKQIREAVDITIGDDGFRSKEVIEILKDEFKHTSVSNNLLGKNLFLDEDNSIQRVL